MSEVNPTALPVVQMKNCKDHRQRTRHSRVHPHAHSRLKLPLRSEAQGQKNYLWMRYITSVPLSRKRLPGHSPAVLTSWTYEIKHYWRKTWRGTMCLTLCRLTTYT
jgi:hypothetical protein